MSLVSLRYYRYCSWYSNPTGIIEREKKKKICERVTEHVKMLHSFQVSKSVPTVMQQEQRCIGIKAEEGRRKKKIDLLYKSHFS